MRRIGTAAITALLLTLAMSATALAAPKSCATIQSGTITASTGETLAVGFDQFGYNYQAHLFVGTYDSSDRKLDGAYWGDAGDYVDDMLTMKWSDDWLSTLDCDGNGKLDRGYGTSTPGISRGWLTNLWLTDDGYSNFTKIVWVGPGGDLWGQYTIVLDVNDPAIGHGLDTKVAAPGFGLNDHWTTN